MSTSSQRIQVSKVHPAVKAILAVTFPDWGGRKVTVVQAGPTWEYTQYVDDQTSAMWVNLATLEVSWAARGSILTGPAKHCARSGMALVMLTRFMGSIESCDVIVEDCGADLSVATDAALAGQGSKRVRACVDAALAMQFGVGTLGGLLSAFVEGQAKKINKDATKAAAKSDRLEKLLSAEVYA